MSEKTRWVIVMCFDPQALTSLTAKTTSGATPVKGFDPQALTSLTFEQCTGIKIN